MNAKQPILVIMGLGKDQKPRAAVFAPDDAEAATKAAQLMGLRMARAESPEAIAITKHLPEGKVYASGKGLLPLVKRNLYDKLLKAVTLFDPATAAPKGTERAVQVTPKATNASPALAAGPQQMDKPGQSAQQAPGMGETPYMDAWQAIEVGATVLWRATANKDEGFFEAIVTAISKDRKMLTLRWRDYPKLPQFQAKRIAVGVICKIT